MEGLVVSLDPDLDTLKRVWVVAEVGEAMQILPIVLRCVLGLDDIATDKLKRGEEVLPPVAGCQYTAEEDFRRIIAKIDGLDGGQQAFNQFVWCMVDLGFGMFRRLEQIRDAAAVQAMARVQSLAADCSWHSTLESTNDLSPHLLPKLEKLCDLSISFTRCRQFLC
jgi:hypothetical protein